MVGKNERGVFVSKKEHSYGIIALRYLGKWEVLLIRHKKGHWAFPKGHPNQGEKPYETAVRELKEETNLSIKRLLFEETITENYCFTRKRDHIDKTVSYYLAEVEGEILLQKQEVIDYQWLALKKAHKVATFPQAKAICQKVENLLK